MDLYVSVSNSTQNTIDHPNNRSLSTPKKRTTTPMQSAKTYVKHTRTYVRTNRH